MNAHHISYERRHAGNDAPKIKTVYLQFGVTDQDLEAKIKAAFDLAKGVGRELSLTFTSGDPSQSAFQQRQLQ